MLLMFLFVMRTKEMVSAVCCARSEWRYMGQINIKPKWNDGKEYYLSVKHQIQD
jgi:hypothetical protein